MKPSIIIALLLMFYLGTIVYATPQFTSEYYIIKSGDTLSKIAMNIYGNEDKWKDIWKLNPQIKDPNLILINQKIIVSEKKKLITKEAIRKLQKEEIIALYCEVRKVPSMNFDYAVSNARNLIRKAANASTYLEISSMLEAAKAPLIVLEAHQFADAVMKVSEKDPWVDMPLMMTAIAWVETHFKSRKGKHGELSYFQILPSTAKYLDPKTNPSIQIYRMKYDPYYSGTLAYIYLLQCYDKYHSWEKAIAAYNGGWNKKYVIKIMAKFNQIKRRITRRF